MENSALWDAVMSLGEPDNEIFVRYYKFGEKLKDISKATGINISTIKTKLLRGKRKLKIILSNAEEMNIDKEQNDFCSPLDIDIRAVKQNVNAKLDSAYTERKSYTMKSKKKISLIAIAATLVLGITVFAASGIVSTWFSSSSSTPDYKSLPTAEQVASDIGYEPVLIESFENGYTFKDGNIVKNNLKDENGNSVEKFKSVSFDYKKDGDTVIFAQDKVKSKIDISGDVVKNVKGTDIYYYDYTNKLVPPDYKLTDDDKKAKENGELIFSYGSSKVEIKEVQSVTWVKDEMQYQLLQIDGKLTSDELVKMAEEILNK